MSNPPNVYDELIARSHDQRYHCANHLQAMAECEWIQTAFGDATEDHRKFVQENTVPINDMDLYIQKRWTAKRGANVWPTTLSESFYVLALYARYTAEPPTTTYLSKAEGKISDQRLAKVVLERTKEVRYLNPDAPFAHDMQFWRDVAARHPQEFEHFADKAKNDESVYQR